MQPERRVAEKSRLRRRAGPRPDQPLRLPAGKARGQARSQARGDRRKNPPSVTDDLEVEINTQTGLIDRFAVVGTRPDRRRRLPADRHERQRRPLGNERQELPGAWRDGSSSCPRRRRGRFRESPPAGRAPSGSSRTGRCGRSSRPSSAMVARSSFRGTSSRSTAPRSKSSSASSGTRRTGCSSFPSRPGSAPGRYIGQVAYGATELPADGTEAVAQKWVAVVSDDRDVALTCINDGSYGSDFAAGELRLSLLRSPAYSADPAAVGPLIPQDRYVARQDQGERVFRFWFDGGRRGTATVRDRPRSPGEE